MKPHVQGRFFVGPWEQLPSPFVGKDAKVFPYTSTYIFKVEGTEDGFVFMADRWNPQSLKNSRHIWFADRFEARRYTGYPLGGQLVAG